MFRALFVWPSTCMSQDRIVFLFFFIWTFVYNKSLFILITHIIDVGDIIKTILSSI